MPGWVSTDQAARHRASWVFGLMDGLLEAFLFAHAVRDDDGEVIDFRIDHVSARRPQGSSFGFERRERVSIRR